MKVTHFVHPPLLHADDVNIHPLTKCHSVTALTSTLIMYTVIRVHLSSLKQKTQNASGSI